MLKKTTAEKYDTMRKFILHSEDDEELKFAEGVKFRDGTIALKWLGETFERTKATGVGIYENMEDVKHLHGHSGRVQLKYLEGEEE